MNEGTLALIVAIAGLLSSGLTQILKRYDLVDDLATTVHAASTLVATAACWWIFTGGDRAALGEWLLFGFGGATGSAVLYNAGKVMRKVHQARDVLSRPLRKR